MSLPWPPEDPEALAGFPRRLLPAATELWRVTRVGRGPWWLSSSPAGRFDLPEPWGTCYLALDPLAALLELVDPGRIGGLVAEEHLARWRLWRLRPPGERSLADLTSREAARWLTLQIHAATPHERLQAWAARLREAGAQGLWYRLDHDPGSPGGGPAGVALFADRREAGSWLEGRGRPVPRRLLHQLETEHGVAVRPRPRCDELRIVGE